MQPPQPAPEEHLEACSTRARRAGGRRCAAQPSPWHGRTRWLRAPRRLSLHSVPGTLLLSGALFLAPVRLPEAPPSKLGPGMRNECGLGPNLWTRWGFTPWVRSRGGTRDAGGQLPARGFPPLVVAAYLCDPIRPTRNRDWEPPHRQHPTRPTRNRDWELPHSRDPACTTRNRDWEPADGRHPTRPTRNREWELPHRQRQEAHRRQGPSAQLAPGLPAPPPRITP